MEVRISRGRILKRAGFGIIQDVCIAIQRANFILAFELHLSYPFASPQSFP